MLFMFDLLSSFSKPVHSACGEISEENSKIQRIWKSPKSENIHVAVSPCICTRRVETSVYTCISRSVQHFWLVYNVLFSCSTLHVNISVDLVCSVQERSNGNVFHSGTSLLSVCRRLPLSPTETYHTERTLEGWTTWRDLRTLERGRFSQWNKSLASLHAFAAVSDGDHTRGT